MDTQLGYWRWKLFRWNDHPNPYRNRSDLALGWLAQFQSNPSAMAEFKNLLSGSLTGGYSSNDQANVLQQLADKMASGEIHVCAELCGPVGLIPVALPIDAEPDISELPGAPSPAPAPAPAPDPPAEATLSGNNDPAAQAQALKDAAESGEPFCEECEKAAAQARQKPPVTRPADAPADVPAEAPVESTLSPDCDAVAQAQALKDASQHGAFFCEECEKARQAIAARQAAAPAGDDEDDEEEDEDN